MEEWRPVDGYVGIYEVSNLGRIKSLPRKHTSGRIMKTPPCKGYPQVNLTKDRKQRVHLVGHLVAAAFIGPRPEGLIIRHLNSDPGDNRPENMVYGTHKENTADMIRSGRSRGQKITHCPSGHEYNAENTYVLPSRPTARYCKPCRRAAHRKHDQAARLARAQH